MARDPTETAALRAELSGCATALRMLLSMEPAQMRSGLERAILRLEQRGAQLEALELDRARLDGAVPGHEGGNALLPELAAASPVAFQQPPPSAPRPARPQTSKARLPSRVSFDDEDLRCPHCGVVVLKRERINLGADRGGAPEFCPKCGDRTGVEPPPLPPAG